MRGQTAPPADHVFPFPGFFSPIRPVAGSSPLERPPPPRQQVAESGTMRWSAASGPVTMLATTTPPSILAPALACPHVSEHAAPQPTMPTTTPVRNRLPRTDESPAEMSSLASMLSVSSPLDPPLGAAGASGAPPPRSSAASAGRLFFSPASRGATGTPHRPAADSFQQLPTVTTPFPAPVAFPYTPLAQQTPVPLAPLPTTPPGWRPDAENNYAYPPFGYPLLAPDGSGQIYYAFPYPVPFHESAALGYQ